MRLEAVFFDFGNTLIRERPSRFSIYAEAAGRAGVAVDPATMRGLMTRAHAELPAEIDGAWRYTDGWFHAYVERIFHVYLGLPREGLSGILDGLFERFSDVATFELFPGATELFEACRKGGLRLGIVSNWSPRLPDIVDGLGLRPWFDVVVCSAIERVEKPDRAIFELALAGAGVAAGSALHAGDHPEKDCAGALAAGLSAVLVDHSGTMEADGNTPRVSSLSELQRHVERRLT